MPEITFRVEALPAFGLSTNTERCPLTRTIFVCGGNPSRTRRHLSCRWWCRPRLNGDSVQVFDSLWRRIEDGNVVLAGADLEVPVGRIRFCTLMALTTSARTGPWTANAVVFRSTCT